MILLGPHLSDQVSWGPRLFYVNTLNHVIDPILLLFSGSKAWSTTL